MSRWQQSTKELSNVYQAQGFTLERGELGQVGIGL